MSSSFDTSAFAQILPESVSIAEHFGAFRGELLDSEREIVSQASPKRQLEFSAGRTCARVALQQLGLKPQPILCGPAREPIWPPGIVGSITHCSGYCAAAVANDSRIMSIGIDAETNEDLPPGIFDLIGEQSEIPSPIDESAPALEKLIFSIKESIFKAWFPITRQWLDFKDVRISVSSELQSFSVSLLARKLENVAMRLEQTQGHFVVNGNYIFTSFCLIK